METVFINPSKLQKFSINGILNHTVTDDGKTELQVKVSHVMWISEDEIIGQYQELIKTYFARATQEQHIQSSTKEATEIEELEKKTKSLKIHRKKSITVKSEFLKNETGKPDDDSTILQSQDLPPAITTAPMGKKRKRKQIDPDKVLWRSKRLKENDEKLAASSFHCNVCQKSFRREDIYIAHMLDHDQIGEQSILVKRTKRTKREKNLSDDLFTVTEEDIRKYQCRLCAHVFLQLDEALSHQKQHAKSSNQMYCGLCDKHFVRRDKFANHLENHKGITSFECNKCGKCFASLDATSKHKLNSCKQMMPTVHKCTICEQDFESKITLDAHEPCNIEGQVEFCCEPCGETFSVKTVFEEHLRSHDMQIIDPHTCATCGLKLASKTDYEEHVKAHDDDIYRCHCCNEVYNLLEDLEMHYQMSETCIEVTCTDCQLNFSSTNDLRTHLKEQSLATANLIGEEEIDLEENEIFICRFCQRGFHTNDPYVAHLKIHSSDKLKSCDTCDQTFDTDEKLGIHYRLVHNRNTKFPCIECGLIFSEKAQLKKHCKETHTNDNIFKCLPCGRTFYQKIEFNRHIVTKQHNKRVVEAGLADSTQHQLEGIRCPICERVCANNRELKRHQYDHQRIQSKPKPEKLLNRDQQVAVGTSESVPIILNDFYNFVDGEHVVLTTDDPQQTGAADLLNARLDIDSEGNIGIIYVEKDEGESSVEAAQKPDTDVEHMLVIKNDDEEQSEISTAGHVNEEAFLALTEMVKQGKIDLSSFQVIQENPKEEP